MLKSSSKVATCTREVGRHSIPNHAWEGNRLTSHVAREARHVDTQSNFWVEHIGNMSLRKVLWSSLRLHFESNDPAEKSLDMAKLVVPWTRLPAARFISQCDYLQSFLDESPERYKPIRALTTGQTSSPPDPALLSLIPCPREHDKFSVRSFT